MKHEFKCVVCMTTNIAESLELGSMPLANRFKSGPDKAGEYRHPLIVSQCDNCGLIQSLFPVPAKEMRPQHSWIQYREPDCHFDQIVAAIAPFFKEHFSSLGISHFDLPLLNKIHAAFPRSGPAPTSPVDLNIEVSRYGMETVQKAFSANRLKSLAIGQKRYDLLVARYVLEHAEDPLDFLKGCRGLLAPSGFLILEIPNSRQPFEARDYHVIWEEHTVYFMEHSLNCLLNRAKFKIEKQLLFPSKFEQPWIILAQATEEECGPGQNLALLGIEQCIMDAFIQDFHKKREEISQALRSKVSEGYRLMLFGAGHFAVAFVNLFNIENFLNCVIDDDVNKAGMYLPGTALPIRPSQTLLDGDKNAIVFCINPDIEEKLKQKFDWFYQAGGVSYSIFSKSSDYLLATK